MKEKNKNMSQGCKGIKGSNIYQKYSSLLPFHGESYSLIKTSNFYSIFGDALKDNLIEIGEICEDTRINLLIPLKSGHGKKISEEFIKKCVTSDKKYGGYVQPTSLHPEQLVGKVIIEKGRRGLTYTPNRGYLAENMVVIEEAIDFFTKKEYDIGLNYALKALDPIGKNELEKRGVNVPRANTLRYTPKCTIIFFAQPLPLPAYLVERGLLRRCLVIYVKNIPMWERIKALENRVKKTPENEKLWEEFIDFLKKLRNKNFEWEFSDKILDKIHKNTISLIQHGLFKGAKEKEFTEIFLFVLHNLMIKMSAIQAAIHGRSQITPEDVDNAFFDLSEYWELHLHFIKEKVTNEIKVDENKKVMIEILKEHECFSKEKSSLKIEEFIKILSERIGKSESTARYYYGKFKDEGLIEGEQVGKHDSRVWLREYG